MKKITLVAALFAAFAMNAQLMSVEGESVTTTLDRGPSIQLTHSNDPATIDGGITCSNDASSQLNAFRSFVLADFGVTGAYTVDTIEFGASNLTGLLDTFPVTLRVWSSEGDAFPLGTLTELGSTTFDLTLDDINVLVSAPVGVVIPDGTTEVAIEVSFPDDGVTINAIGTNNAGQTAPSWVSGSCVADITDILDFDLANSWTINANVTPALSVEDNLSELVSVFPNPASTTLNISASNVDVKAVALYNVLGKQVQADFSNNSIDVSNLAAGVYILNIETSRGTLTQKVVKQ